MNSHPITLAILSFNHPEITRRCLQSCFRLNQPAGLEIHLLHNGSRPELVEAFKKEFPQVRHMVLAENRGFAGGASALLSEIFQNSGPSISSEASLRWALFLSNDCELEEGALQEPSEAGLYAPTVLRRKTGQVESLGGYIETGRFRLHHCKDAESFNQRCKTNTIYIPGASFWIDQNSWSRLGSFNEGLFAYWEDVELSLRASKLGIPLGLHPSTRLRHGIGKTCHKDPYYTSYLYQRNRIWVARAHLPFTQRIFFGLRLGWEFLRRSAHQIRSGDLSRLSLSSKAFRRGFFSKNPVHL